MKKAVWISLGLLVAISAVSAACGGGDDGGNGGGDGGGSQTSAITVNKGAEVQALVANLTSQNIGGAESASDDLGAVPAAAGSDASVSNGGDRSIGGAGLDSVGINPAQSGEGGGGITVQGYGSATAEADSAVIEFYFGGNYYGEVKPEPPIGEDGSSGSGAAPDIAPSPGSITPITEETLQPVIDALVGAGVSADDIEFVDQGYYDPYYASATLRATVNDISAVDGAVSAATDAAAGLGDVSLQSTNVMYTIQDCSALEQAALEAAVEDANERGDKLAAALSVGKGAITAAADYSYYGPNGTGCGSNGYPVPYYDVAASGSSSSQVQVFEQISITFAIQ